jgi:hypothetical protein
VSKKSRNRAGQADKNSRKEKADRIKRDHAHKERRKNVIIYSAVGVVVIALIGGAVLGVRSEKEAAQAPIEGLTQVRDQESEHVPEPVAASALPPTGGNHSSTVQNCGVYTKPVAGENAVHALEHGVVWLSYQPTLPDVQVDTLDQYAQGKTHVLVAPYRNLAAPVVATAWGRQLELPNAEDPRLARFVKRFLQGPQTPEPGAPCSGGTGNPI